MGEYIEPDFDISNEPVPCPLCGHEIVIMEYRDLISKYGIKERKDIHGFIPVCWHCGSDFLMCDTRNEALANIASIPKIENTTAFCINCNVDVDFDLGQQLQTVCVHGKSISYPELTAFCPMCGDEVYSPEINDINIDSRTIVYSRNEVGDDG